MKTEQLAKHLARGIFAIGDDTKDRVQRIEFKGGKWPDEETRLGGLCERSLATEIKRLLETVAIKPNENRATN